MIRTLVVDDDFRVAKIHAAYVSRVEGFEAVGHAPTVAAALDAVRALDPALLLLDVYLPDGSGLEVLQRLTGELGPDRPDAIVITAARDKASVRSAMKLGAVGYLVKPFGFDALAERLTAYRAMRARMDALPAHAETEQADVDALFTSGVPAGTGSAAPAKGHSAHTLELVRGTLHSAGRDLSAGDVADLTGVSRATAQRYLSYLVRQGAARLELRYGSTGRPEHRYHPAG